MTDTLRLDDHRPPPAVAIDAGASSVALIVGPGRNDLYQVANRLNVHGDEWVFELFSAQNI